MTPVAGVGTDGCARCGSPAYEADYKIKLCAPCRRDMSRYPVKRSVLWAAVGVAVLMLLSFYRFPEVFKARRSYERALNLEKEHKYMSAEQELLKTLQRYPESLKASAHLMIAAFHNGHLELADSISNHWAGVSSKEDDELISRVNDLLSSMKYYNFEDDSFAVKYTSLKTDTPALKAALLQYTQEQPNDVMAAYLLADQYYDEEDYQRSDSILQIVIKEAPDFHPAYGLLASAYREQKKFKEATAACYQLLNRNAESVAGNITLATILLKQHQDQEALKKAQAAYAWAPNSTAIMKTLALAYHFNNQDKACNEVLSNIRQSADTSGLAHTLDIIKGNITYRD
jgi:Putative Zn-dependent protease, contains TPR repeats